MKKIGIMGGTFNPIHNGHLALAQAAYEFCDLDEVWFMPSGVSYLKSQDDMVSGLHRLKMTELAVGDTVHFKCSDMEVCREGYTYTADTLRLLHEKYPEDMFYFIMGADSLFGLPQWREPEVIASLCTLVTVVRDDVDAKELMSQKVYIEKTFHAKVITVPFQKVDISSSIIRKKLSEGKFVDDLLPEKVLEYIKAHGLYKEDVYGRP
ncbi:MAG: nicotinate-nucleotide adenylyltransferase [Lachnospiraceae bacterium]|nr:nicotinate-nucleotide adenylyltransferase [Lachnospiraceae bacterium]